MKILTTFLILIFTFPAFGQFEVFPTYKFVERDSLSTVTENQFLKSIKVKGDTIHIKVGSIKYAFISTNSDKDSIFNYPEFIADFDLKYNLEISSWEVVKIDSAYATFKISYTRRFKSQGGQKGKYYTIENFKIDKDKLVGFYIGEVNKKQRKRANLINLGLAILIVVGVIIGNQ